MRKSMRSILTSAVILCLTSFSVPSIVQATQGFSSCSIQASVTTGDAPLTVVFTATTLGFTPRRYWWNFGDYSGARDANPVSHTYISPGTFTVNLSVRDEYGNTATAIPVTITVQGQAPSPLSIEADPQKGEAPLTVNFTAIATGITPRRYWWKFGDGNGSRSNRTVTHTYTELGDYKVKLTVRDRRGRIASAEVMIEVTLPGPTDRTIKDLGKDYPEAIIYWDSANANGPLQALQGDIDGNGIADFVCIGNARGSGEKRYVGVFFDATLSSLKDRVFSEPDFMIVTQDEFPWKRDVVCDHPMHWLGVDDLNNDGYDDIVFAMPIIDLGGGLRNERGEVYVVLGDTRGNLGAIRDFSIDPPDLTFIGKEQGDRAGFSIATGDINGDGQKDLLIGAPLADGPDNARPSCGEVYAITRIDWSTSSIILTEDNIDLYIYGESAQQYGIATITGNLNGDFNSATGFPLDDIIVAPKYGPVKMIFGQALFSEKILSVSFADWVSDYEMQGRSPNMVIGDINGDGIEDLAGGDARGTTYLTYGSINGVSDIADVTINTPHAGWDRFDFSKVFSDFDGDGIQDLVILAPYARGQFDQYTTYVGEANIIWGQLSQLPATIDLATEATHFTLYGSYGTGPTGLSSNFQYAWNSAYGYVFGMELENNADGAELLFGDWKNTYIYKVDR